MERKKHKTDKEFLEDLNKKYEEYKKKIQAQKKEEIKPPSEPAVKEEKPAVKKGFGFFKKKEAKPSIEEKISEKEPVKEEKKEELPKASETYRNQEISEGLETRDVSRKVSKTQVSKKKAEEKKEEKIPEKATITAPSAEKEEPTAKKEGKLSEKLFMTKETLEKETEEKQGGEKESDKQPEKIQAPKEKKHMFSFKKHEEKAKTKEEKKKEQVSDEYSYKEFYKLHKHKKKSRIAKRHLLETFLEKAGLEDVVPKEIRKKVLWTAIIIAIIGCTIALIYAVVQGATAAVAVSFIVAGALATFAVALIIGWLAVYFFLDMRIFSRTQDVERVLPDFLQLTSANISAGMPIDKALWMAIRPQFGVLSYEIQEVAKATMAGESLEKALHDFTDRYQSPIVTRAVNLLLEGLAAGGEMAELLNKIAIDIQELRLMRKEMAADVMTYVLFITVATVFIAPLLFGLATQLLTIVQHIMANLNLGAGGMGSTGMGGMFSFNFSEVTIKLSDFRIFCISMLCVSSFFSACIISMIRKGNVKEGFKYIPIFIVITITLYFLASWGLGKLFSGFF